MLANWQARGRRPILQRATQARKQFECPVSRTGELTALGQKMAGQSALPIARNAKTARPLTAASWRAILKTGNARYDGQTAAPRMLSTRNPIASGTTSDAGCAGSTAFHRGLARRLQPGSFSVAQQQSAPASPIRVRSASGISTSSENPGSASRRSSSISLWEEAPLSILTATPPKIFPTPRRSPQNLLKSVILTTTVWTSAITRCSDAS
jgi:hypothetical protein